MRCDWPHNREVNGRTYRINGYVLPDATEDGPDLLRTWALCVMAALPEMPVVVPRRNGTGDDADLLAQLAEGRWDSVEEFLDLRFEAIDLLKTKRFRRLAVAVYAQLIEPEVLDRESKIVNDAHRKALAVHREKSRPPIQIATYEC